MKTKFRLTFALFVLIFGGCGDPLESARRLHIPQGSAERGKTAFVALNCIACHTVSGVELPRPAIPPEKTIPLGGDVVRLRSVGDLLTSIIHPGFSASAPTPGNDIGEKKTEPMPVVNDVMTVSQMIDLVAFLQPQYKRLPVPYDWDYSPPMIVP